MTNSVGRVQLGREAYERHDWTEAYAQLAAADAETPLSADDLDRLAAAANLMGVESQSFDAWTRAHYAHLREGNVERAVRSGYWLGLIFMVRQDFAQAGGWLARGERLIAEHGLDCVEAGYLIMPQAARLRWTGEDEQALANFRRAYEIAHRFNDPGLLAFSQMGIGETLLNSGDAAEGWALLDEVMAALPNGEVSPLLVGVIYCAVLSACQRYLELRRSQEWTAAFMHWCESQTGIVPYRGECLVYKAELLQLKGAWPIAMEEARRACVGIDEPGRNWWAGPAFYQQGEVNRLRGDYDAAEEAYRQANQWGFVPQPGLALLRAAQGRTDAANSALARVLAEVHDPTQRARLLAAQVAVLIQAGNVEAAAEAAAELDGLAAARRLAVLEALSLQARGAVLLAQGACGLAINTLRRASAVWRELDVPYEVARSRVLMAQACRALGDEDGALFDLEAARTAFRQLGARPDVERVNALLQSGPPSANGTPLTPRELEVLRLIAAGHTNRAIADALVLSEKTVARHVSNIFARVGISSRAAATAYAYEHGLV